MTTEDLTSAEDADRRLTGVRVLLGDPHEGFRQATAALLTEAGAEVRTVDTLDALVDQAKEWEPSVVITADRYEQLGSIVLPVTPKLLASTPKPGLIIITTSPDPIKHQLYLKFGGANWVMVKGTDPAADLVIEVAIAHETYQLQMPRSPPTGPFPK